MSEYSLAPWLTVPNGKQAIEFYKLAFGAVEKFRHDDPDGKGTVARLSVYGAEFWLSDDSSVQQPVGGGSVRIVLMVPDPDIFYAHAIAAGATEICSVKDDNGYRVGRLADPNGLHWEIGKELD